MFKASLEGYLLLVLPDLLVTPQAIHDPSSNLTVLVNVGVLSLKLAKASSVMAKVPANSLLVNLLGSGVGVSSSSVNYCFSLKSLAA